MTSQIRAAPSDSEAATLLTIMVDYNRIGYAKSFRTALLGDEMEGLSVGATVRVLGDDVRAREAVAIELFVGTGEATFAFCD